MGVTNNCLTKPADTEWIGWQVYNGIQYLYRMVNYYLGRLSKFHSGLKYRAASKNGVET